MYLTEYQKVTVENFMGLWNRGSLDDVPQDHASDIRNMAFARKRETVTRGGTNFSRHLPNGQPVIRQFEACFAETPIIPLACDGIGNIWRLDNFTVLLNLPGMIDFDALNMNGHVYIAPIMDPNVPFNVNTFVIYVWADSSFPIRKAAGIKPPPIGALIPYNGGGNIGPGYYGFAYCYVMDTGYVSPPSQVSVVYVPANSHVSIGGLNGTLPNLIPGLVGFLILSTKAQADQLSASRAALYEVETSKDISSGGATISVNFFDTDLVILASADPANGNLLNTMPLLPTGVNLGSVALIKYHGRMIIIGPSIVYDPTYDPNDPTTTQPFNVFDGRIFVSHPGAPENFDDLTGYLVVQAEFDGNIPRTGFELFGVLYICKAVGTFGAQDNGSDPNDPTNPWVVNMIDGGIGAYHHGVGTITGSQPSLSFNSTAFLANRNGLFIFNGNVLRPELTWKIRALWQTMVFGQEYAIRVTIDIFNDIFYVMFPTTLPPPFGPNIVLMGDYSLGLDSNNIRWSIYIFPYSIYDILMCSWDDPSDTGPTGYFLRLGTVGQIYKLSGDTTADQIWAVVGDGSTQYSHAVPIDNYYQLSPLVLGDIGSLNICRFIRYRMAGQGTLMTTIQDQGEYPLNTKQATNVSPDPFPGNYRDIGIQTNFTNEKAIVKFEMNNVNDYVRMARVDVFGKARWPTRPNA